MGNAITKSGQEIIELVISLLVAGVLLYGFYIVLTLLLSVKLNI